MTCIVGWIDDDKTVWLGGDSLADCGDGDVTPRRDEKVFERDGYLIGFCGDYRVGQIVRYEADLTPCPDDADVFAWVVMQIVPALRKALADAGYVKGPKDGWSLLLAFCGHLLRIDDDFSVGEALGNFDAIGSGAAYALGAFAVMPDHYEAWEVVENALKAAEQFRADVRGPFTVMSIDLAGKVERH